MNKLAMLLFSVTCIAVGTGIAGAQALSFVQDGDVSETPGGPILFEDRESLSLEDFKGKVLVLELGGVGCPLTESIYKELREIREEYPSGVDFVRVDYRQSVKRTKGYYEKNPPNFHVIGDPSGQIGESLPSQAYPTLYLFGKWGKMRFMGGFDSAAFRSMTNRLLAEKKPSDKNFFLDKKMDKGDILPNFTLPDVDGDLVDLGEFRRNAKAFVLVFAGTGCPISSDAVRKLGGYVKGMNDEGISVLVVNIGEDANAVKQAYQSMKLPFPVLVDAKESLVEAFGIETVPTLFVAGSDGRIAIRSLWNFDAVSQEIDVLLGKLKPEDRKEIKQKGTG